MGGREEEEGCIQENSQRRGRWARLLDGSVRAGKEQVKDQVGVCVCVRERFYSQSRGVHTLADLYQTPQRRRRRGGRGGGEEDEERSRKTRSTHVL
jgi:hypothetical protein